MLALLSGCAPSTGSRLTAEAINQIAPDVPEIPAATQLKAAEEIDGGKCPALADLADACLVTRDESRLLHTPEETPWLSHIGLNLPMDAK